MILHSLWFSMDVMPFPLKSRSVFFVGKLAGLPRRDAERLVRSNGGRVASSLHGKIDLVVIGQDSTLGTAGTEALDAATRLPFEEGRFELMTESEFWQILGLDSATEDRSYSTPAMLAELTGVSTGMIRLWHRRGFLESAKRVGKLPYFDFSELVAARQLSALARNGLSADRIATLLNECRRAHPEDPRPLLRLTIPEFHGRILYRDDAGREIDGMQPFFDWSDAPPPPDKNEPAPPETETEFLAAHPELFQSPPLEASFSTNWEFAGDDGILERQMGAEAVRLGEAAWEAEQAGNLDDAIRLVREALAWGVDPPLTFQLAELLFRREQFGAARERYAMVLEIEPDHLEARLGLAQTVERLGEFTEAEGIFRALLAVHPSYSEAQAAFGTFLFRRGRLAEAEDRLRIWRQTESPSPRRDAMDAILREIQGGR